MSASTTGKCEHRHELPLIVHREVTVYVCLGCGRTMYR